MNLFKFSVFFRKVLFPFFKSTRDDPSPFVPFIEFFPRCFDASQSGGQSFHVHSARTCCFSIQPLRVSFFFGYLINNASPSPLEGLLSRRR